MRDRIAEAVSAASKGLLERSGAEDVPAAQVTLPKDRELGDLATNHAFLVARALASSPTKVAEELALALRERQELFVSVSSAGPGFLNFRLTDHLFDDRVREILTLQSKWGTVPCAAPKRIQLEFVSANPTGPLNVVNARAGALGDVMGNLLAACGHAVQREFYINDAGRQAELFGLSVEAAYLRRCGVEAKAPPEGYHHEEVSAIADLIHEEAGSSLLDLQTSERRQAVREKAVSLMVQHQRQQLDRLRVGFDKWFSEQELHQAGEVDRSLSALRESGHTYEHDGALWLRTTTFGDDKDRVLVKGNGERTYLVADIAYHLNKFSRGFEEVVDIWGPDHHGHVARMKASLLALGFDPDRLRVLIAQQVNFLKDGERVAFSKRAGEFVTIDELLEAVGVDAARFFFLLRRCEAHMDFDLDLARSQSQENPVYYVQYAHARICSVFRLAADRGVAIGSLADLPGGCIRESREKEIILQLDEYPQVIRESAHSFEPHRLAYYLYDLANSFHVYYNHHRILSDDPLLTRARLALCAAVQITIQNGLNLFRVAAPQSM